MDEQKETSVKSLHKEEIDYIVLLNKLWSERKTVIIALVAGAILGLLIAFLSPKEFKVTTTMLPQSDSQASLGKFSSLASLAGFDLDLSGGESDISPVIYPQIVESAPFLLELMNSPFTFSKIDHPVSLYEYFMKLKRPNVLEFVMQYTVGLPAILKKAINGKKASVQAMAIGPQVVTEEQDMMMKYLKKCVTLVINKKEGYLTLTCTFPEAMLTAQVAEKAQELLQKYITEFKTKKSLYQLNFIEERYAEKKADYLKAQNSLAWYSDRNQHVSTAVANAELERLQNENQIAYAVYSELAKSLEQYKIQVKKATPVFAIIKPVVVPIEKFKPQRTKILILFTLLGGIVGVAVVAANEYKKYVKGN